MIEPFSRSFQLENFQSNYEEYLW